MINNNQEKNGVKQSHNSNGQVKRIDDYLYVVKSQSHNGEYTVNKVDGEWLCDCADFTYRHVKCKHIHAVNFSLSMRAEVKVRTIIPNREPYPMHLLRFTKHSERRCKKKQSWKYSSIRLQRLP